MKIIDFVVALYSVILPQKYGIKRVGAGIFTLTIFVLLNTYSLVSFIAPIWNYFLQTTDIVVISFIVAILPTIFVGFIGRWKLEKYYLNIKGYKRILQISCRIPRIVAIIFVVIHYLLSVFFVCYCLSFAYLYVH